MLNQIIMEMITILIVFKNVFIPKLKYIVDPNVFSVPIIFDKFFSTETPGKRQQLMDTTEESMTLC